MFARRCVYVRNRPQPSATVRNRSQPFATVRNRSQSFATVRNRSQPFATVRNRSQLFVLMAVPMVSFAEGVTFGGFKRLVSSFRMAGVALRDVQMCLVKGRKSFCVAGAILLRRFQKMRCSFRGRCSTLDVSCGVFVPTSLCGVLVFGCALPPRLPPCPSCPSRPPHTRSHTHNLSTYNLSHTQNSLTTYSHTHTQLLHAQLVTAQLAHTQLDHTQFVHTLRGRRGAYGTGLALVARLGPSGRRGRRGCWQGRRGTW